MSIEFLQQRSRSERLNLLHANAQKRIDYTYFKHLSEDELNEQKELYFDKMAQVDVAAKALDVAKAEYKLATELPSKEAREAYKVIKAKGKEVTEEVYLIPNYDSNMIDYINENGECVYSRRMLPEERQIMMKVSNE